MAARANAKADVFDLNEVLGGAIKDTTVKKGTTPVLVDLTPSTQSQLERLIEVKNELDSLKTEAELLEAELVKEIGPRRMALLVTLRMRGQILYVPAVKVLAANGQYVTCVWQHKYSKIDRNHAQDIQNILGSDEYAQGMKDEMEITTKPETNTPERLKALIGKIGVDEFQASFDVARWLYPTPRYTEEIALHLTDTQHAALQGIIRQYKPSFRVK